MQAQATSRASGFALLLGVLLLGVTGCGVPLSAPPSSNDGRGDIIPNIPDTPAEDLSAPTFQTVMMSDPVDNAFTMEVPAGWDTVAYSSGGFYNPHNVVSSLSPDGKTVLFMGDQTLPVYWNPVGVLPNIVEMSKVLDFYTITSYQPAESYFPEYVTRKFGELPGFEITGVTSKPDQVMKLQQTFIDSGGYAPEAHIVDVFFDYTASGETIHALVNGMTLNSGPFWAVDLAGLATNRDVEEYLPMVQAMSRSLQITDDYKARAQANHDAAMAQIKAFGEKMTGQHNANMRWIKQSAAAHQSRMEAIWAQGDASMQNYYNRMDSMDHTQRDFLNYITEEETVSGGATGTRQVASGATNYWVNKYDNSYVGGDINFGDSQLREMGLNPDDYEQVNVVK